jgi:hypothetical protein
MRTPRLSKPHLTYVSDLARAGWDGVVTAPKDHAAMRTLSRTVWAPVVMAAGLGVLSACVGGKRRSIAMGGLVGTAIGLGGMAWASRGYTEQVARNVMQKVNVVRDARWLEKNPIAYA